MWKADRVFSVLTSWDTGRSFMDSLVCLANIHLNEEHQDHHDLERLPKADIIRYQNMTGLWRRSGVNENFVHDGRHSSQLMPLAEYGDHARPTVFPPPLAVIVPCVIFVILGPILWELYRTAFLKGQAETELCKGHIFVGGDADVFHSFFIKGRAIVRATESWT